jgi:2-oxoglutarate ferredoxin oxidoreductase subunit beta
MNDFVKAYGFHSLHGRAIPNGIGIKLANHKLPVIVVGGDGDLLGEGGNHFMHGCRGNFNMTVFIHDNQVYGLTTGQVSPMSSKGHKSKSTPSGIIEVPSNPLALAITHGATFVGQGFAGDIQHLSQLMKQAIEHPGFSVVNVCQPCVTFNKTNTYQWFRERIYKIDDTHDRTSKMAALEHALAIDEFKVPLGVLYETSRPTYEESVAQLAKKPLVHSSLQPSFDELVHELV